MIKNKKIQNLPQEEISTAKYLTDTRSIIVINKISIKKIDQDLSVHIDELSTYLIYMEDQIISVYNPLLLKINCQADNIFG